MYTALVLVKNLDSESDELNFAKFKLTRIQEDDDGLHNKARKSLFPGQHADKGDWIYEKNYHEIKPKDVNKILNDVIDIFFLLRLFKVGDLVFLPARIEKPNGLFLSQLPYRVLSDIHPFQNYELEQKECSHFDGFSSEIVSLKNWNTPWFQTARRFFMYGCSKEFNPKHNEVDRIVDYMIVMESILVPETDFVGRRLRERAANLLENNDINYNDTKQLLKDFYKVRSTIVHGGDVESYKNGILDKQVDLEKIVREVMKVAVKNLPEDDVNRVGFLKSLFDIDDQARASKVFEDFCVIRDANEKQRCFDLISKRL